MRNDITKSELQNNNWTAIATIEILESIGWDFSCDKDNMDEAGVYSKQDQKELNVRITHIADTGKTYETIEPESPTNETGDDAKTISDVWEMYRKGGMLVDFEITDGNNF